MDVYVATLGYVGPGPGLGLTWALAGLLITVLSAAAAVVLWPLRVLIARFRHGSRPEKGPKHEPTEPQPAPADSTSEG